MKVSRLDRPCLVEKWVHLGGVLTGEEGDAFVAVGDLRGTTPPQRRRTSLGKELRETSRASRLHFGSVVSFPLPCTLNLLFPCCCLYLVASYRITSTFKLLTYSAALVNALKLKKK